MKESSTGAGHSKTMDFNVLFVQMRAGKTCSSVLSYLFTTTSSLSVFLYGRVVGYITLLLSTEVLADPFPRSEFVLLLSTEIPINSFLCSELGL